MWASCAGRTVWVQTNAVDLRFAWDDNQTKGAGSGLASQTDERCWKDEARSLRASRP